MRTNSTAARNKTAARRSASIRSILSLAGGMAAVPLVDSAAEAEIIVTSTQGGRVGSGGVSSLTLDLPGTANMVLAKQQGSIGGLSFGTVKATITNGLIGRQANNRSLTGQSGSNVAFRTNANVAVTWNANGANRTGAAASANIIRGSTSSFFGPGAFSNKFLLFTFTNSLAANQTNYGWVEMTNGNITDGRETNTYVTFGRWAYQNDGSVIGAGETVAVPEPTTAAMAMAGALVAGAAGLRRYRKQQAAAKAAAAAA